MLAYMAFVWNPVDPARELAAQRLVQAVVGGAIRWDVQVNASGLAVVTHQTPGPTVDRVYKLEGQCGVILGRLFRRSRNASASPIAVSSESQLSDSLAKTACRALTTDYWGRYVAFVQDSSQTVRVTRDPTGAIPCHSLTVLGVTVYFCRLEDCLRFPSVTLTINRRRLIASLVYHASSSPESCLNEVATVLPGEQIRHAMESRDRMFSWNPLAFIAERDIEDAAEAISLMRTTVRETVHAWASCFNDILLYLSGGLDSAIVFACLRDAPNSPNLTCLNVYAEGAESDERTFARQVTRHAGYDLLERHAGEFQGFANLRSVPPTPNPMAICFLDGALLRRQAEFAVQRQLQGQFGGFGGDEVFYRGVSALAAPDFVYRHGIRPSFVSLALQDSTLTGASVGEVLVHIMRAGVLKEPWSVKHFYRRDFRPLIADHAKAEAQSDLSAFHPLFRGSPTLPPAKISHAYNLTFLSARDYSPLMPDDLPVDVRPLSSQPLLELSLRIPTYILKEGGVDRSIARRAFRQDVPRAIQRRTTKGIGTELADTILRRNLDVVRPFLLDGYLTESGILDKGRLSETLARRLSRIETGALELATYLNAEAWARSIQGLATGTA